MGVIMKHYVMITFLYTVFTMDTTHLPRAVQTVMSIYGTGLTRRGCVSSTVTPPPSLLSASVTMVMYTQYVVCFIFNPVSFEL